MNAFHYSIPTEIFFGQGQLAQLPRIKELGSRVLLVCGGGSIRRSGLYDAVQAQLKAAGVQVWELDGVDPNPRIQSVRRGAELCRAHEIQVVLAVGGGSVIDCAKVIAAAACYAGDAWELVTDGRRIQAALPVVSVLTLAATGSEMDHFAVISDLERREKLGTASPLLKPRFSILDPANTYSVPPRQTAAGTADIMSHTLENYFTRTPGAFLQAGLCEAVLRTCIHYLPIALENPEDYEARANLMWASSLAINGLLSCGAEVAWCVHPMEHELSAFYDIIHGEGLAILTPFWMDYVLSEDTVEKFAQYGVRVWDLPDGPDRWALARQAIQATRDFFGRAGLPATLGAVGIGEEHLTAMAEHAVTRIGACFVPLTAGDVLAIYRAAL